MKNLEAENVKIPIDTADIERNTTDVAGKYSGFWLEFKKLSVLAWPLLIAQVTQTLMGVSDTIMAGHYNSLDMAAVAIGYGSTMPLLIFLQGICLALSPQVARLDGAKNANKVASWVQQCFYLVVTIGFIFMMIFPFVPSLLAKVNMAAELRNETSQYIQFILLAAPGFAIYQTLRNYCEGLSSTRPTMIIMLIGLCINVPANYLFINGIEVNGVQWIPEMGGAGCGLATMLVIYGMALSTFIYTRKQTSLKKYDLYSNWTAPTLNNIKTLLVLGLPIAFTLLAEVTLFSISAILLSPFGALTVASHQVALNFSALIFMLPLSIGMAVAIRIGYVIGEGHNYKAALAYRAALVLAISTVFFTTSFTVINASWIVRLYTPEVEVITAAIGLLILAAIFQFPDAIQVVGANSLRGYKDNKAMLLISLFAYWGIGFPTAIVLGLTDIIVPKMAAKGFWIGFILGLSSAAIMMTARVLIIQQRVKSESSAF